MDPGFEEAEREFIARECGACPHGNPAANPLLDKLLRYMRMQDGRCPVERHELLDIEWEWLGVVRSHWEHFEIEWQRTHKADDEHPD